MAKSPCYCTCAYHHPLETSRGIVTSWFHPIWIRHALQVGEPEGTNVTVSKQKNPRNDPTVQWLEAENCPKTCFFHVGFHEIRVVQEILNAIPIVDDLKIPRTEAGTTRNKHHFFFVLPCGWFGTMLASQSHPCLSRCIRLAPPLAPLGSPARWNGNETLIKEADLIGGETYSSWLQIPWLN